EDARSPLWLPKSKTSRAGFVQSFPRTNALSPPLPVSSFLSLKFAIFSLLTR
ncbi:unnamed protein product, partial [Prunus brigantina]